MHHLLTFIGQYMYNNIYIYIPLQYIHLLNLLPDEHGPIHDEHRLYH